MRARTELPSITYRITAELPCVVAFPSATYHVRLIHCLPSGRHYLAAYDSARAVEAPIGPDYRSREALTTALFTTGIPVRVDTIGATIMRRLVRDGRAVVVAG